MFIDQGATFYHPDGPRDWRARLLLWRRWSDGPMAVVCGANPSVADAERLDPTMRRIISLLRDDYGGYFMVNAEAIVDPAPASAELWRVMMRKSHPDEYNRIHCDNMWTIAQYARNSKTAIAAWGNLVDPKPQLIEALSPDGRPIMCWGTNLNGSPRHPLARGASRIPDGAKLTRWK